MLRDPFLGTNPSFLRFVKCMRMDLSSDELQRVFVRIFELIKMKRGTHQSWWGIKRRESIHFTNRMAFCRHLWRWNLFTFHSVNWVNQLVSEFIHFHESCHSFESFKEWMAQCHIVFGFIKSMLPSLRSCYLMFKRETILRIYTCSQNNLFESVTFESVLWLHHT